MKWKKLVNNEILEGGRFYVSYNKATKDRALTELANNVAALGELDIKFEDGLEETALCKRGETKWTDEWYILNGDFRKEYEDAFPKGFEECLKVYEKHKTTSRSPWSNDEL